jgi:hypothetical protein
MFVLIRNNFFIIVSMNKKRENFIFIYGKNSHNFESIKIINILTQVQEFA